MNLIFRDVTRLQKDGQEYILQAADVTYNKRFWIAWRQIKPSLQKVIALRRENGRFNAYRLMPTQLGISYGTFKLSYSLRDTSKLLPYQTKPVRYICNAILRHNAACDGSDTGLGKTFVALACARELQFTPAIICKKAGIATWKRALQHFGMDCFFLVNWERAKAGRFRYAPRTRDEFSGQYTYTWKLPPKTLLIFDEAHVGSNPDSQNHALWTGSKGYASLSLSATFADRPKRLSGLMYLLGIFDRKSFLEWLRERGHFTNEHAQIESLSARNDLAEVNRVLYPHYGYRLSYKTPEVKKFFPEAVYQTEIITIGARNADKQNELYKIMLEKAAKYHQQGKQADKLVAELRYRQASELLKADALADLTIDYLLTNLSVLLFVNYRETLIYLAKRLNTDSVIYGGQDKHGRFREEIISDFQAGKSRVMICMVEAGGQSISLHDLTGKHQRLSLICPTYNPITLKQVCGRTHRAGSKTTPIIKLAYSAGTIEEKVSRNVSEKIGNIDALNEGDLMPEELFNLKGVNNGTDIR